LCDSQIYFIINFTVDIYTKRTILLKGLKLCWI